MKSSAVPTGSGLHCFSAVKVFLDKRCVLAYNSYNKNITETYDGEK